jgi:hypothetical protein
LEAECCKKRFQRDPRSHDRTFWIFPIRLMGSTGCIELEMKRYTANYRTMFTSEALNPHCLRSLGSLAASSMPRGRLGDVTNFGVEKFGRNIIRLTLRATFCAHPHAACDYMLCRTLNINTGFCLLVDESASSRKRLTRRRFRS